MDLNWLLCLLVLVSSLSLVARGRRAASGARSWFWLGLALSAATLVAMRLAPAWGGYVVGTTWAVLVLAPALLMRAAQSAAQAQRYARTEHLLGVLSWLHPSRQT